MTSDAWNVKFCVHGKKMCLNQKNMFGDHAFTARKDLLCVVAVSLSKATFSSCSCGFNLYFLICSEITIEHLSKILQSLMSFSVLVDWFNFGQKVMFNNAYETLIL